MGISLGLLAILVSGLKMNYLVACVVVAVALAFVNFNAHGRWSLMPRASSRR
jgi:hypothetical protein